jgi:transcriptional regulator with XRE-family HTH domain
MAGEAKATDQITSPVVWRRWLSADLVRLRNRAKLTQRDAAHALRCSVGKLSYLESGDRTIQSEELEILLRLYNVPKDHWQEYLDAAAAADQDGWWDAWADEELPKDLLRFIGLEDGARRIRTYNPSIVAGLLQTPDYAAAIIDRTYGPTSPERTARIAELRTARQPVLDRRPTPLEFHAVLDEAAVRRKVGGPRVWRQQMATLLDMVAQRSSVTVQILPFDAGAHTAMYGPFTILDFDRPDDRGVVYVESFVESILLESRTDVDLHSAAFTQLVDLALDQDQSLRLVRSIAEEST